MFASTFDSDTSWRTLLWNYIERYRKWLYYVTIFIRVQQLCLFRIDVYLYFLNNLKFKSSSNKVGHLTFTRRTNSSRSPTSMYIVSGKHWKVVVKDMSCLVKFHNLRITTIRNRNIHSKEQMNKTDPNCINTTWAQVSTDHYINVAILIFIH